MPFSGQFLRFIKVRLRGVGIGLKQRTTGGIDCITPSIPNHEFANYKGFLVLPNAWLHHGRSPNFPLPLLRVSNQYAVFFLRHPGTQAITSAHCSLVAFSEPLSNHRHNSSPKAVNEDTVGPR